MLLAGDIGGTKTVLAVYDRRQGPNVQVTQKIYPSARYDSLEAMIREFLLTYDGKIENACFGVAGPVIEGRAQITNLPWVIDAERLRSAFGWEHVDLLNDLEAVACAIPILQAEDIYPLSAGKAVRDGSIAVIAPGTGLGEAYLTCEDGIYTAHASEGAHSDFAPVNPLQMELLRYLWTQKGLEHVSYEWVCSGIGIPNLYAFLKASGCAEEPDWLADELAQAEDPTPVIVRNAGHVELCGKAVDLFVAILGAEAGNQALKVMATGGVYLGGGIPPRILEKLKSASFLEAMRSKGRFREVLANIPVTVILNPGAALKGAAAYSLGRYPLPEPA